ncbi:MAG: hydrolase 1, exosortase A system-associated [Sulfuricella sp.]|nr:hydrolase 1, exosortase A system-associated [Sulfuricella sp.]
MKTLSPNPLPQAGEGDEVSLREFHANPLHGFRADVAERAIAFPCHDAWLYGILSVPERAISRGVLIVVGGPQYRAGSHRQFTLLARHLAAHGIAAMRFDYRGMGDSEGDARTFEEVNDDLRHAIDRFFAEVPALREVAIWGLCDAASAALFYAPQDRRVTGLALLNPWIRTEAGIARATLKHYYLARLFEPELWRKIRRGRFDYAAAARSLAALAGKALPRSMRAAPAESRGPAPLPERMFDGLNRFTGRTLLIMSGNDLTAREFSDLTGASPKWRKLLASPGVTRHDLPEANHTFSRREWRDQVADWTCQWAKSW